MTPGIAIKVIADAFKADEVAVEAYDRRLVAAGMRSTGGRGLNAAQVTSEDVGRLILATLLVQGRHGRTVPIVNEWWNKRLTSKPNQQRLENLPTRLKAIVNKRTCKFGAALSALIEDCVNGELSSAEDRFCLEIVEQDKFADIKMSPIYADLGFTGSFDLNEDRPQVQTTHKVTLKPFLAIAKAMRD